MSESQPTVGEIKQYWNDRADQHGTEPTATTDDIWLREIEIRCISDVLGRIGKVTDVLDIGCGNGYATIRLAELHPFRFLGGDFATGMIEEAERALSQEVLDVQNRVEFRVMDVLELDSSKRFDVVISDRCLINLPSQQLQLEAVDRIAEVVRPGGIYIAVENFVEPQRNFDALRVQLGLPPIPVRWHNTFLDEEDFVTRSCAKFQLLQSTNISSSYYMVTRGVYSKLCSLRGDEPGYDDAIYEVAAQLPFLGEFGPVKLLEFHRK